MVRSETVIPKITIEQMQSEDLDEIARLEKGSFSDPWPKKAFEAQLNDGASIMLAARLAGQKEIVGYLCAYFVLVELQLASVAVKNEYRGMGIGEKLVREMIRLGLGLGAEEVWLDVRESNLAARRLYQKLGFREVYRRKNYYRKPKEDALVMFRTAVESAGWPQALKVGADSWPGVRDGRVV